MLNALYTIIIYPLYQVVEFVFRLFYEIFKNYGIAIIGVSIAISLLCLPLYAMAEKWQEVERNKQRSMKDRLSKIKKAFKGDEQYLMISAYYRVENYRPSMALRSTFGLLIQVPFFIAAYSFLSHNSELLGQSFLFIKDMGKPDAMFKIGSFSVNVLPILMTVINCIAGAIYTKGFEVRDKVQVYGMALFFLVILYGSPAGLVFYWTMNNVFSLVKHIFYKLKNPLKVFHILCSVAVVCATILLFVKGAKIKVILPVSCVCVLVVFLPFILSAARKLFSRPYKFFNESSKQFFTVFMFCAVSCALLCGIVIPSFLMKSSPQEYCYLEGYSSPLYFLNNSFLQALGLFVFWPVCIYFLFGKKVKFACVYLFLAVVFCGLVDNFIFPGHYGTVLPEVIFTEHISFIPKFKEFLLNSVVLLAVLVCLYLLLFFNLKKVVSFVSTAALSCMCILSVVNYSSIGSFFKNYQKPEAQVSDIDKIISLSPKGKNVMVIMLDRSTGYMIDPVFENNPYLYDEFDGFTLYPNTVAFGSWTIQGAVCLYGGYEYTPWEMNQRRDVPMVDKHNEGISLQANLFSKNGYKVTVMDPPYPNYDTPPLFKAFENLEDVSCYKTLGKYNQIWTKEHNVTLPPVRSRLIKRNFIWFSLFKISPMILRSAIHYEEFWNQGNKKAGQDITHLIDNYSVLDYLPELTDTASKKSGFVIMDNELCHDQIFTQYPEYEPSVTVTDKGPGELNKNAEYHVNVAAYKKLGEYFAYLKKSGVYDNTRIVIVADHGALTKMAQFGTSPTEYPLEKFNPVLMVKDFNSHGKLLHDNRFMTHADVPAIAIDGLLKSNINPYTQKEIRKLTTEEKNEKAIISMSHANSVKANVNNGYKIYDNEWYKVHDSIFDEKNWTPVYSKQK